MNIHEDTPVSDNLGVKVYRHNSWQNKVKRALGVDPRIEKMPNCKSTSLNLADHTLGCGFLTASVRRWDDELKQYMPWEIITDHKHNLLTNGGRDFFHVQCYGSSGLGSNGTNYVAVTTSTFTPAAGDTTLASEETLHGFARAQGTVAHTNGTNQSTVSITFTATGTETALQASGLFTASSVGTLSHEATFTATNFVTNDQLGLTWTLNLG